MGSPSMPDRIRRAFSRQSSTREASSRPSPVPPADVVELRPASEQLLQVASVLLDGGLRFVLLPVEHHEGRHFVAGEQDALLPVQEGHAAGRMRRDLDDLEIAAAQVDRVAVADDLDRDSPAGRSAGPCWDRGSWRSQPPPRSCRRDRTTRSRRCGRSGRGCWPPSRPACR